MSTPNKVSSDQEFWQEFGEKYSNQNPIAHYLINNFFKSIQSIIKSIPKQANILEIGCGPGESTKRIVSALDGHDFEASEFDQRFVSFHQKNNFPVPIRQESVYELQRKDNEYHCLIMLEVLEHLENYELALSELCRVSNQELVISVPHEPIWRILNCLRGKYLKDLGNTPGHINHWSKRQFIKLLEKYCDVKQIYTPIPWLIAHCQVRH